MAAGGGYSITIRAVDQVSSVVDGVNKKLAASQKAMQARMAPYQKSIDGAAASLKRFSQLSGLDKVGNALAGVGRQAGNAYQTLSQMVPVLGVITSVGGLAALNRMVAGWADWGSKLSFAAQRIGMTSSELLKYQNGARLAGASSQAMTSGLQSLGQAMYDAVGGRAPETVAMFNTLGIAFSDATGHARSVTDVLPQIADKIKSIKDPYTQARVATELFGGASEELLPYLRQGSDGIARYNELATRYGAISQSGAEAANQLRQAQARLTLAGEGLANKLSERLAPVLVPLINQFSDWLAASPQVAHGIDAIGHGVETLGNYLKSVDWSQVGTDLQVWGQRIGHVVEMLGGAKAVIVGFLALMAARFALGMIAPWANLAISIGGVIARFAAMRLAASAAATAAEGASVAGAAGGIGIAGRLGIAGLGGLAAHELMKSADPDDKIGAWIDRNIPGAAAIDNMASKVGLGRSYQQQKEVEDRINQSTDGSAYRPILDMLGRSEGTDKNKTGGYNATLGFGAYGNSKGADLTGMTLSQVADLQKSMLADPNNKLHSSAVGRYQFVSGTLAILSKQLGLDPNKTTFSPEIQDQLAIQDLKNRGADKFLSGEMSATDFQLALSKEWASVANPYTGHSYYGQATGVGTDAVQKNLAAAMNLNAAGPNMQLADAAPSPGAVNVSVDVTHRNPPPGSSVVASASGDGVKTPRVARSGIGVMEM